MKNKISKVIIALFIYLCAFPVISFAQTEYILPEKSEAFERWESLEESERANYIQPSFYAVTAKNGIQRSKYSRLIKNAILEQNYNLADFFNIIIKDQKRTESCWAFSATSMLETNVAFQKGLLNQEYSPYHIDYRTYDMYNRKIGAGGNIFMAIAYMVNGYGPVLEKDLPMNSVYDEENNSSSSYYLTDRANVDLDKITQLRPTQTTEFPTISKKYASSTKVTTYKDAGGNEYTQEQVTAIRNKIKTHIKTYGAVSATMYIDIAINTGGEFVSNYYNAGTNIFRCTSNTMQANHQVVIVGWDDSKSSYIVQNSYGATFGDGGYFYVSYDDNYIEENIYGINDLEIIKDSKTYDNIYQYDELGANYAIGTGGAEIYFSNVFEREIPEEKDEYINEVGLYVMESSGIEVYVNSVDGEFTDQNGNSKLKLVSSGNIFEPGYHVIKLNPTGDTKLTGSKFIIAIKAINQEGATIPLEANWYDSEITYVSNNIYNKAKASAGQSYISTDGATWTDILGLKVGSSITLKNTNTCVRAFTKYVEKQTNISVKGIELDKTEITLKEGKSETLKATILPVDATNKNITWESSNEAVAEVKNGVITAKEEGTTNIKVTTEEGGYTATCEVIVEKPVISVTGIALTPVETKIKVNETCTLNASVMPENATNKNITWESSNEAVAKVQSGVVTGISEGTATIKVKTEDGNYTATCQVVVEKNIINVTGITLNKTKITLKEGESETLKETILPVDATNKNITWESSNEAVAKVKNGIVTAISEGIATIKVKTEDGNYIATCQVNVEKEKPQVINVTGVTLDKINETLKIGKTLTLIPTIMPENATNKNITWESSNEAVAKVQSGVVTGISEGTATIKVKTEDGNYIATCQVVVEKNIINVTGITLNKTKITLKEGESETLKETILPVDATNKNITWESSNEAVAKVKNGIVTAISEGIAVIKVRTEDGNYTDECKIIVEKDIIKVTGVEIEPETIEVKVGTTINLLTSVKVLPENATNKNIILESLNEEVATISEGIITALKEGIAVIKVRTEDGNFEDTMTIVVKQQENKEVKVESIEIDKKEINLEIADKATLIIIFNPELPSNAKIKWESSNPEVATIDENGIVTAVGKGKTTITATSEDGGHKAQCVVIVTKQVADPDDIYKIEDPTINQNPIPNAGVKSVITLIVIILIAMVYSFIKIRLMKDVK